MANAFSTGGVIGLGGIGGGVVSICCQNNMCVQNDVVDILSIRHLYILCPQHCANWSHRVC